MNKMIKRFLCLVLSLCVVVGLLPAVHAQADETEQRPVFSQNEDAQSYSRCAYVVNSYLEALDDGGYMRVEYSARVTQYDNGSVHIEYYSSDLCFLSSIELECELPIFGGFYNDGSSYYLVFGDYNACECPNTEVIRIVKYSHDWQRLDSVSLYGINTETAFRAGSLRMSHSGDHLYIRTAHRMFQSADGLNHQANLSICVDTSDMKVTDSRYGVSWVGSGYVSHSFNQFIQVDGEDIIAVDHGDAYPRSIVLFRYDGAAGDDYMGYPENVDLLNIIGETGDNYTGASVGGLEISGSHYLVAGNSILQDGTVGLFGQRNIFVIATEKDDLTADGVTLNWLTNYADGDNVEVSNPQLVKVSDNKFCILWTEGETLCYAFLNGDGSVNGTVYKTEGALSDCKPVVAEGKILWYVTYNSAPEFFIIDTFAPETVNTFHEHYYTYSISVYPTETREGELAGTCIPCGLTDSAVLPAVSEEDYVIEMVVEPGCEEWGQRRITWKNTDYGTVSYLEWVLYTGHSYEGEVIVVPTKETEGSIHLTCTVCGAQENVTLPVLGHWSYDLEIVKEATCLETGVGIYTWNSWLYGSYSFEVELPADNHSYTVTYTEVTCTEDGLAIYTCQLCGHSYEEVYRSAWGHWHYSYWYVSPTCTEQGYWQYECLACGEMWQDDFTDPLGHTPGETVIENEIQAQCGENGGHDEVVYCTLCGEEISRTHVTVESKPHTPGETVVENEIAADCTTAGGYDEVTYCIECGKEASRSHVTVDALGHTAGETVRENETEATCMEAGGYDEVVICAVCGEEISRSHVTVDALGHTAGETVCENETDATCTEAGGYDEVVICAVCGEEISRSHVTVDATGHTPGVAVRENYVAPSGGQEGSYDEVVCCKDCGTELSRTHCTVEGLLGDVNCDGWVDAEDAALIMQYEVGLIGDEDIILHLADVNADGWFDAEDAALIMQLEVGLIDEF